MLKSSILFLHILNSNIFLFPIPSDYWFQIRQFRVLIIIKFDIITFRFFNDLFLGLIVFFCLMAAKAILLGWLLLELDGHTFEDISFKFNKILLSLLNLLLQSLPFPLPLISRPRLLSTIALLVLIVGNMLILSFPDWHRTFFIVVLGTVFFDLALVVMVSWVFVLFCQLGLGFEFVEEWVFLVFLVYLFYVLHYLVTIRPGIRVPLAKNEQILKIYFKSTQFFLLVAVPNHWLLLYFDRQGFLKGGFYWLVNRYFS